MLSVDALIEDAKGAEHCPRGSAAKGEMNHWSPVEMRAVMRISCDDVVQTRGQLSENLIEAFSGASLINIIGNPYACSLGALRATLFPAARSKERYTIDVVSSCSQQGKVLY